VDDCVVRAFAAKQAFYATYESTDREIEDILDCNGYVGDASGGVFVFQYGFAPYHSLDPPETFVLRRCSAARVVTGSNGHAAIACW
jgi:hypothetical protein